MHETIAHNVKYMCKTNVHNGEAIAHNDETIAHNVKYMHEMIAHNV